MHQKRKAKRRSTRTTLRLPDLDHSKNSVLQSLGSAASKRTYGAAIEDFITWYCSEPRLAFGRTVVLRYRYELESRRLAPATINLRLAAVRLRIGNLLTAGQGSKLLEVPGSGSIRDKRDHAMLSLLLGCGLRRAELTGLTVDHLQQRDEADAVDFVDHLGASRLSFVANLGHRRRVGRRGSFACFGHDSASVALR